MDTKIYSIKYQFIRVAHADVTVFFFKRVDHVWVHRPIKLVILCGKIQLGKSEYNSSSWPMNSVDYWALILYVSFCLCCL